MEFGANLPLMDFGGNPYTLDDLVLYTRTVEQSGFVALAVNDHMVFATPWLDGPTVLTAVLEHTGTMDLATTIALPVVRGPVPLAKTFAAIDRLSGGRVVLAVGPGSSPKDYESVGIDFDERWKRLDEAIQVLRSLWSDRAGEYFDGDFYSTKDLDLRPRPVQPGGPPVWMAAGDPRRDSVAPPGWATAGSPPHTTPPRPVSPRHKNASPSSSNSKGAIRQHSRMGWRPCGSTSPTILPRPSPSTPTGFCPSSTDPRK